MFTIFHSSIVLVRSAFTRGPHTLTVSAELFKLNRQKLCERLRTNSEVPRGGFVLLQGGISETRHCSDHEPVFRQESYFHWTFGVEEPDFYGAIEVDTGKAILFQPKLPESYAVWMGKLLSTEDFRNSYGVDEVYWSSEIAKVLTEKKASILLVMMSFTEFGKTCKQATFDGISNRVLKTEMEIEVIRYANRITSEAQVEVMKQVRPGMYEYQLVSGPSGAILWYGHAGAPNAKQLKDGEMCFVDLNGEYYHYTSDITCCYPVNGKFTEKQRGIHDAVCKSNKAVLKAAKPGVCWVDLHKMADRIHLEELKKIGLVRGDVDEMVKVRLGRVFFPHGLGHLLGVDTLDVGNCNESTERREAEGVPNLRTERILQPNMVMTVEPGIYFIDAHLDKALNNPEQTPFLNTDLIEEYRGFGGVRVEDTIVITENGAELLTCASVPRTVEEIEAVMAEGKKSHVSLPQDDARLS
ncbi:hypothetical protein FSP39_010986 [Pinctada imbricata]|uniref:Xaa-Pro dipeptidase n=1 Tax=Pinctada imbricata TaxID=66713 RepID=A0AA88XIM4_PINIB|nr:hypothetical protein FSP39_010986 [Pinctada imbricata]